MTLVMGALLWAAFPFSVDDAFITARYALRLAGGRGYTFRDGDATDGVTGPLWLLPLSIAGAAGVDPLWAGKLLGGALSGLSVLRLVLRVRQRSLGRLVAPLAASLCLTSVPLITWACAGLETGLSTFVVTELALGVTAVPRPAVVRCGLCAAALAWLRPELALSVFVLLVQLSARSGRRSLSAWLLAGGGVLGILLFRQLMFGHLLPMSAAAKPAVLGHGVGYALAAFARVETLVPAIVILVMAVWRTWRLRALGLAVCAHGLAVVLAGGDWMPGFRLFAPLAPLFAWLAADALARLALLRPRVACVVIISILGLRAPVLAQELKRARAAGENRTLQGPRLARHARAASGPVLAVDVGILAYLSDAEVVDLAGLTEPRIAYAPGGHLDKKLDSAWLRSLRPGLIVLHTKEPPRVDAQGHLRWFRGFPVERRVLELEWVLRGYRVRDVIAYASDYHYVLLAPR